MTFHSTGSSFLRKRSMDVTLFTVTRAVTQLIPTRLLRAFKKNTPLPTVPLPAGSHSLSSIHFLISCSCRSRTVLSQRLSHWATPLTLNSLSTSSASRAGQQQAHTTLTTLGEGKHNFYSKIPPSAVRLFQLASKIKN